MIEQSDILRWFEFSHLPIQLQPVSAMFRTLAWQLEATLPDGEEKQFALRKLLEAKDCAVRSAKDRSGPEDNLYHVQQVPSRPIEDVELPEPGGLHAGDTSEWRGALTEHPSTRSSARPESDGNWLEAHDPDPSLHPLGAPSTAAKGPDWPDDAEEDATR
jgi:hypothetical protein